MHQMLTAFTLLLAAQTLRPVTAEFPRERVELPMTLAGHLPVIELKIGGLGPYKFAICTGVSGDARVDRSLGAKHKFEIVQRVTSRDATGARREVPIVVVPKVDISGVFLGTLTAVELDLRSHYGDQIDGILGFNAFSDCLLTLDYQNKKVVLEQTSLPVPNQRDVLRLTTEGNVPTVRIDMGEQTENFIFDSGSSSGIIVPRDFAEKLNYETPPLQVAEGRSTGNTFAIYSAPLNVITRLGQHELQKLPVGYADTVKQPVAGYQFLKQFTITFDQRMGRIRLVKPSA